MSRPRIVIVGAGFAGYRTAKELSRKARGKADITLLNPTDHFLYLPLLPQVAAGILEPRRVTVSLAAANPLHIPLSGPVAGAVTRGYHLAAMPGNRVRVAADWLLDAVLPCQAVQLGLVRSWSVPLESASPELARVPGRPGSRQKADARSGQGAATAEDTSPDLTEPAEPGNPMAEQADPPELTVAGASAGEAVIAEAKAREAARGRSAEGGPGDPAKSRPGGEPANNRPAPEPAKNQPSKNHPGGEPRKSLGAVQNTHADSAEGDS